MEDRIVVEIDDLESRTFESPALSLYVTFADDVESPRRFLDPLLRELGQGVGDAEQREYAEALRSEIQVAERQLEHGRQTASLAVFSCRPAGLLEVFELPDEVPPMMVFGEHLETWPLREQFDRHPEAVVHRRGRSGKG